MLCTEYTLVNDSDECVVASPLYCNCWTCDICAPRRKRRLMSQGFRGKPDIFITLTCNPAWFHSPAERAQALAHAWRKVVRLAKKRYHYKTIPYLCVFEATKKGEPHLHILARCAWLDQKWLAEIMTRLVGAPVCWVTRVKNKKRAAYYVSKYCGKDPHRFPLTKRYWQTRDYEVEPMKEDPNAPELNGHWWIAQQSHYRFCEDYQRMGYRMEQYRSHTLFYPHDPPSFGPRSSVTR